MFRGTIIIYDSKTTVSEIIKKFVQCGHDMDVTISGRSRIESIMRISTRKYNGKGFIYCKEIILGYNTYHSTRCHSFAAMKEMFKVDREYKGLRIVKLTNNADIGLLKIL